MRILQNCDDGPLVEGLQPDQLQSGRWYYAKFMNGDYTIKFYLGPDRSISNVQFPEGQKTPLHLAGFMIATLAEIFP